MEKAELKAYNGSAVMALYSISVHVRKQLSSRVNYHLTHIKKSSLYDTILILRER